MVEVRNSVVSARACGAKLNRVSLQSPSLDSGRFHPLYCHHKRYSIPRKVQGFRFSVLAGASVGPETSDKSVRGTWLNEVTKKSEHIVEPKDPIPVPPGSFFRIEVLTLRITITVSFYKLMASHIFTHALCLIRKLTPRMVSFHSPNFLVIDKAISSHIWTEYYSVWEAEYIMHMRLATGFSALFGCPR